MRFLAKLTLVLIGLPLLYLGWTAADIWQTSKRDQRSAVQAIVVMGAAQYDGRPSPVFRARLDHAGELERDGVAPLVVVLGGKQQGDRFTEAQAGAAYLERTLPASQVTGVGRGHSTLESLEAFRQFAEERGLHRILIVSDPFHLARSQEMARDLGFETTVSRPPRGPASSHPGTLLRETLMLTYFRFFEREGK
jgi:uncharacterized SAM-binding protein YcdF (DUF218 family)